MMHTNTVLDCSPFYAFESLNCSAVPFSTLAEAQEFVAHTIPVQDLYDSAADARSYQDEYKGDGRGTRDGWKCATRAQMLEELEEDAEYETAEQCAQRYA